VAVLDVMLPGIDGYEVCRAMRGAGYQAGVIMLTARTQEADKVTGLMNGADDYVTKPFNTEELLAHIKTQLMKSVADRLRDRLSNLIIKRRHGLSLPQ